MPQITRDNYVRVTLIRERLIELYFNKSAEKEEAYTFLNILMGLFQKPVAFAVYAQEDKTPRFQTVRDQLYIDEFKQASEANKVEGCMHPLSEEFSLVMFDVQLEANTGKYIFIPYKKSERIESKMLTLVLRPLANTKNLHKVDRYAKEFRVTKVLNEMLQAFFKERDINYSNPIPNNIKKTLSNSTSIKDREYINQCIDNRAKSFEPIYSSIKNNHVAHYRNKKPTNVIFHLKTSTRNKPRKLKIKRLNGDPVQYHYDIRIIAPDSQKADWKKTFLNIKESNESNNRGETFYFLLSEKKEPETTVKATDSFEENVRFNKNYKEERQEIKKFRIKSDKWFWNKLKEEGGIDYMIEIICLPFGDTKSVADTSVLGGFRDYIRHPNRDLGLNRTNYSVADLRKIKGKDIEDHPELTRKVILHYLFSVMAPKATNNINIIVSPIISAGSAQICMSMVTDMETENQDNDGKTLPNMPISQPMPLSQYKWHYGHSYYYTVVVRQSARIHQRSEELYIDECCDVFSEFITGFLKDNVDYTIKFLKSDTIDEKDKNHQQQKFVRYIKKANHRFSLLARVYPFCRLILTSPYANVEFKQGVENQHKKEFFLYDVLSISVEMGNNPHFYFFTKQKKHLNAQFAFDRFNTIIKTLQHYYSIQIQLKKLGISHLNA